MNPWAMRMFSHCSRYSHFSAQEPSYSFYFSYERLSQLQCPLASNSPYQTWSHPSDTENWKCLGVYIHCHPLPQGPWPMTGWNRKAQLPSSCVNSGIIYSPELHAVRMTLGFALLSFFPIPLLFHHCLTGLPGGTALINYMHRILISGSVSAEFNLWHSSSPHYIPPK